MRTTKKLVVLFVIASILASLISVPALAAELDDALKLEKLGILKGTGSGVNAAYRSSTQTRYQAAWLFLRLLGKETEAKAYTGGGNFTDAATAKNSVGNTLNAENRTMLAYLYANQNLGFRGYTDNTFRPFDQLNFQMYYKLMLVALGYIEGTDFSWDNVFDKSVEYGLAKSKPSNAGTFTIDRLAEITVATLRAKVKGSTKTLVSKLVDEVKSITNDAALESGVLGYIRKTYADASKPIRNLEDVFEVGPPEDTSYMLSELYTGNITIKFDVKPIAATQDSNVSFVCSQVEPLYRTTDKAHYYSHHSIMVALSGGNFRAISGNDWVYGPKYSQNTVFHVRIEADMNMHTYQVFVSSDSMPETQIGRALNFRTRGFVPDDPANEFTAVAENLAMVVVGGSKANQIEFDNLVITDDTP